MSRPSVHSEAPAGDPLQVFVRWFDEAERAGSLFPDAFALATATRAGRPSVRYVLYKGLVEGSLRLVTNFESRKARELEENPHAALAFFWPSLGRQVRMEGTVSRATDEESDRYFAGRDRETQLGAWASAQSRPLASRKELDERFEAASKRFAGTSVPRPPSWGMLAFRPSSVELWTSGPHRLHDRFLYEREKGGWRVTRLAP